MQCIIVRKNRCEVLLKWEISGLPGHTAGLWQLLRSRPVYAALGQSSRSVHMTNACTNT